MYSTTIDGKTTIHAKRNMPVGQRIQLKETE